MEIVREIDGGKFDAQGAMIEGARITLHFLNLELDEFKQVTETIIKTFGAAPTDTALRKNRRVVVATAGEIHDGGVPTFGRLCDV